MKFKAIVIYSHSFSLMSMSKNREINLKKNFRLIVIICFSVKKMSPNHGHIFNKFRDNNKVKFKNK